MKNKNKTILISLGLLALLAIFISGPFAVNFRSYSNAFYGKDGDSIVLTINAENYEDLRCFIADDVNAGGRNWLTEFAQQEKGLDPDCYINGLIYHRSGWFPQFSFTALGISSIMNGDLYCCVYDAARNEYTPTWYQTYETMVNTCSNPTSRTCWDKASVDAGTTVTWTFSENYECYIDSDCTYFEGYTVQCIDYECVYSEEPIETKWYQTFWNNLKYWINFFFGWLD